MPDFYNNFNDGFIPEIWESDYLAAVQGADEEILPLDMRPYRSSNENQFGSEGDKLHCVSRSDCNAVEGWLNFRYQNNLMPQASKEFLEKNGYIVNGKVELNVRFLSAMSDTTRAGNSMSKVAVTGRQVGYTPRNFPGYADDVNLTWEEYYDKSKISQALKDLAKEFTKHFEKSFSWVATGSFVHTEQLKQQMAYQSRQGVLQVATAICSPWDAKVPACELSRASHAYIIDFVDTENKKLHAFDHYPPHAKELAWNYIIPYVLKIVVKPLLKEETELHPSTGVGTLMKVSNVAEPGIYQYCKDKNWHGLDDMEVLTVLNGVYDPSKTLKVPKLPSNVSFTIARKDRRVKGENTVFSKILQFFK